LAINPSYINIG
jgi:hypothetical protein